MITMVNYKKAFDTCDKATTYRLNDILNNLDNYNTNITAINTTTNIVANSNLSATHKITRSATIVVAASDSSAKSKAQADYVCDGTNDEVEIQAAITAGAGGKITLLEGNYIKGNISGISVPSNTEIELLGTIKLANNVGDGAIIFKNSDSTNDNIRIIGGILDGNRTNQSSGHQTAIQFTSVNRSVVDTLMQNFCGYNVREINPGIGNTIINRAYPNSVPEPYRTQERLMSKWKLLDDFSEGWQAVSGFGTLEYDENIKFTGTKSVHISIPPGVEGKIDKTLPQFDLRNKNIGLRVRAGENGFGYIRMYICTPDWNNGFKTFEMRPPTPPLHDTWYIVGTDPYSNNGTYGTMDMSKCSIIRIEIFGSPSSAQDLYIDAMYIADKPKKRGAVILNFDDGNVDIYTNALPLMDQYGYRGVIAVSGLRTNTASYPNYISLDMMHEFAARGWDIINHMWSHPSITDDSDFAYYEDELRKNQDFLKSNNLGMGYRFFRPMGQYVGSPERWELIQKYTALGCGGLGRVSAPIMSASDLKTVYYFGDTYTTIPTVEQIKAAVGSGQILHYGFHNINDNNYGIDLPIASFEQLLTNIRDAGADVITLSDFYEHYLFTEPQTGNTGTATITAGQTTVDVTHGLAAAPTRVILTPTTALGGKFAYVSAKAASTFTITIDSASEADISFDWYAVV